MIEFAQRKEFHFNSKENLCYDEYRGDICLIFTKVWLWTLNNISENLWTCILTCCKFSEDLIVQSNTWMQTCGWRVHEIDPWWIGFVFNLNFHKSLRTPLKHFYSGFIKGIFLKKNLTSPLYLSITVQNQFLTNMN